MVSAQQVLLEFLGKDASLSSTMSSAKGHMDNLEQSARKAEAAAQHIGNATTPISEVGSVAAHSATEVHHLGNAGYAAAGHLHEIRTTHPHVVGVGNAAHIASQYVDNLHYSALAARAGLMKISDARTSILSLGTDANTTSHNIENIGKSGTKAGSQVAGGMKNATSSVEGLNTAISGVIAGFGAVQILQAAFTGSMQAEFNQALLTRKFGDQAAGISASIREIVSDVPGDDTFMNALLTGAAYKAGLTNVQILREMGNVSADYLSTSTAMGKNAIETQMDLKEYILTGNTTQLERDSILKNQLDKLEGQATVEDRIKALQAAMREEGYEGLSQLEVMSNKWETVKGKLQEAATSLGLEFLPYLESGVNNFLEIDEKTGGWVSKLTVISGLTIGIVGSLGLIAGPIRTGIGLFTTMADKIRGLPKIDPASCGCPGTSGPTTTTTTKPGLVSRYFNYFVPAAETIGTAGLTAAGVGIAAGLSVPAGIIAAGYGALQSGYGVLSGQVKPFQGYGQVYTGPTEIVGTGKREALGGGLLDLLMPKGASAADGAGGKHSFQQDLSGLFDMSRFHVKMPDMNVIPNAFKTSFNTAKNWTTQGISTVTGFMGGLPGRASTAIMPVIGAVTTPFTQAWSQGEAIVWGGVNTVTGAFWSLYSGVDSSMQSMYNTIVNWTSQGIAMLQKLYCMVFGCSPGLLPAFRALGKEVPIHLGKTMPYLSAFSNSINNIPDVKMGSMGGGGAGGVHYHVNNGSYTIDASHLSLDELEGLLIRLFEGKYKPNVTGGS